MNTSSDRQFSIGRQRLGSLARHLPALLLALVLAAPAPLALAQYVPNPDTAKNRQDNVFGTRPEEDGGQTLIGNDPTTGDQVMEAVPPPPECDDSGTNTNLNEIEVYPIRAHPRAGTSAAAPLDRVKDGPIARGPPVAGAEGRPRPVRALQPLLPHKAPASAAALE